MLSGTSGNYYEEYTLYSKGYYYSLFSDSSCKSLLFSYYTPFNSTCNEGGHFKDDYPYNSISFHTSDQTIISSTPSSTTFPSSSPKTSSSNTSFPVYAIILVVLVPVLLLIGGFIAFFLLRAKKDLESVPNANAVEIVEKKWLQLTALQCIVYWTNLDLICLEKSMNACIVFCVWYLSISLLEPIVTMLKLSEIIFMMKIVRHHRVNLP